MREVNTPALFGLPATNKVKLTSSVGDLVQECLKAVVKHGDLLFSKLLILYSQLEHQ